MSFKPIICDINNLNVKKLGIYIPKKKKSCFSVSILYNDRPLIIRFPQLETSYDEKFDNRKYTLVNDDRSKIDAFVDAIRKLICSEVKSVLGASDTKHQYFSPLNKKRELRVKQNQFVEFDGYDDIGSSCGRTDVELEALAKLTKFEDKIFISFWGKSVSILDEKEHSDEDERLDSQN